MMVFQRKQIVVLSLVILIVLAGYLQYSYKKSSTTISDSENGKLGEAVYVDNKNMDTEKDKNKNTPEDKNKKDSDSKKKADVEASKEVNDYFTQVKLDREASISKNNDDLRAITEDINASEDIKAQAYEKMIKLVERSEMEMKIESLVADKGFSDVLVLFGEDGGLDIIVKAPTLTAQDVAKISDIAARQANVDMDKIYISNKY